MNLTIVRISCNKECPVARYVFATKVDYSPEDVTQTHIMRWSCSKTAQAGDEALVYVVGIGFCFIWEILDKAKPDPEWKFMCPVKRTKSFARPIEFAELKREFSRDEWPVLYTHFRGLRSFAITDGIFDRICGLR
jgi:hypothetical protein